MMASEASVRPTSQTIIRELVGPGDGDAAVMFSLSPGGLQRSDLVPPIVSTIPIAG